jgi:hypothetical protein
MASARPAAPINARTIRDLTLWNFTAQLLILLMPRPRPI